MIKFLESSNYQLYVQDMQALGRAFEFRFGLQVKTLFTNALKYKVISNHHSLNNHLTHVKGLFSKCI